MCCAAAEDTCLYSRTSSAGVLAFIYCATIFIHMGSSSRGQMLGKPTKSELKLHYNHHDFNQGLAL